MSFQFFLSCLYFFLPAYFVNMAPPLAKRIRIFDFLNREVDFKKRFMDQPIFGNHKTWRGVVFGILMGFLAVYFQRWLYQFPGPKSISFLDYSQTNLVWFGFLISAGAVFGDLIFAFVKRRLKLEPGAVFIPFDQTNYVIGAAVFLAPFFRIDPLVWVTLFMATFILHVIINRLGYQLGVHKNKW